MLPRAPRTDADLARTPTTDLAEPIRDAVWPIGHGQRNRREKTRDPTAQNNRSRGEQPKELFSSADEDPAGMIQVEHEHCCSTGGRLPDQFMALPPKMF